jgi:hypothetical protein
MSEPEMPEGTKPVTELSVDRDNLYREEVVTDLKAATLRRLMPIRVDGTADDSRTPLFLAETQLMTQGGVLPVQARLEAETLEAAIDIFPEAINAAVERMVEEAREMQRREQSRIVVPGQDAAGKIQLR